MANSVLAKMAVEISANNAKFAAAMSKSQRDLSSFTSGIQKMAGALGLAFSIQRIADFTLEVSRLAGEAKAVRGAFERLPESTKLMRDLTQATHGTVSELDLMKRAVQASNFGISLGALPKLLEFATLRAQQTGQSVDYLVDSIVTGIGRKSKLILDNLGISAVQLNEALGDTAIGAASIGQVADAVGSIIDDNMEKMNTFMDNNSSKLQRLSASWINLKVAIGGAANETGLLGGAIDTLTGAMDLLSSRQLTFFEKLVAVGGGPGAAASAVLEDIRRKQEQINKEQRQQEFIIKQIDEAFTKFKGNIDEFGKAISPDHPLRGKFLEEFKRRMLEAVDASVTTLKELRDVEKELIGQAEETNHLDTAQLKILGLQISAIREKIKAAEDLLKVEKEAAAIALSQTAQRAIAGAGVSGTTDQSGLGFISVDSDAAIAKMEALRNKSAEVTEEVATNFIDLSGIAGGAIGTFAEALGGAIVGVEDFGGSVLKAFASFAKEFGQMLIASGVAALALRTVLVNPFAAIAAGSALVALAGAASASLSKATGSAGGSRSGGAPGQTPSEVKVGGRIKGYDLAIVNDKESYRRGRMG